MRTIVTFGTALVMGGLMASGAAAQAHNHAAMNHGTHQAEAAAAPQVGHANLINDKGESIGHVMLYQGKTGLLLNVEAKGLTPGWHGIHIHATGQCEAPFTSAGAHINHATDGKPHGLLNPNGPDDGDLPNIHADAQGNVAAQLFTTRASIAQDGPGQWLWDADGSAIVIHANADDHTSQPIGGAGGRVACAVVRAH